MVEKDLTSHFPPSNLDEWKEKVLRELRIENPEELSWMTPEGFPLQALYHLPEYLRNTNLESHISAFPLKPYSIWEPLQVGSQNLLAKQLDVIQKVGIEHLFWESSSNPSEVDPSELQRILSHPACTVSLPSVFLSKKMHASNIHFRTRIHPWEESPTSGEIEWDFRTIYESGGSLSLQLATCLAAMAHGLKQGMDFSTLKAMHFTAGTCFYLEIAKFRVLPSLLKLLFHQYGKTLPSIDRVAHSSLRDLGKNDTAINAIRSTLAALAASLGGCQGICISPIAREPNPFDLRLGRNIHFLLAEEGKIHKVQDPLAGSYYIEELGEQLGKRAWEVFLDIESLGGLSKAWEEGIISKWMKEGAEKEQIALENKEKIKIAENSYLHG